MRFSHLLSFRRISDTKEIELYFLLTCFDVQVILLLFQATFSRFFSIFRLFICFNNLISWKVQTNEEMDLRVKLAQEFIICKFLIHVSVSILVEELALHCILLDIIH